VAYILGADADLETTMKQKIFGSRFKDYDAYREKVSKASVKYLKNIKKLEKITGIPIRQEMRKEQTALKKILNVKKLPRELRYSIDHLYGISEAVRNPKDKVFAKQVAENLVGGTVRQNTVAGLEGYSVRRKALINNISKGKKVTKSLARLNELTTEFYPQFKNLKQPYKIVDGQLTFAKGFRGETQPERFKSYFKDIAKTKKGAAEIKRQHGSLKNLLAKLCPNKASGGRVGFQGAGSVTTGFECGQARLKEIMSGSKPKPNEMSLVKKVMRGAGGFMKEMANPKQFLSLRALLGPEAMAFFAAFEAGAIGYEHLAKGVPIKEALGENWLTGWAMPKSLEEYQIADLRKKGKITNPAFKNWAEGIDRGGEIDRLYNQLEAAKQLGTGTSEIEKEIAQKSNEFISFMDKNKMTEDTFMPGSAGEEEFQKELTEKKATELAKDEYSPIFGKLGAKELPPRTIKRIGPRGMGVVKEDIPINQRRFNLPETAADFKYPEYEEQELPDYARQEWEDIFSQRGLLKPRQSLSELVSEEGFTAMDYAKHMYNQEEKKYHQAEKIRQFMELPGSRGTQDWRGANGGIASLTRTTPPERGPQHRGLDYLRKHGRGY